MRYVGSKQKWTSAGKKKKPTSTKEENIDYSKYSVEIDMGFNPISDLNEDVIRRRKEEEMNRKIERE